MDGIPFGFPDENIDPKKKLDKKWMQQYAQAAMYRYNSLPSNTIGWSSRNRYDQYTLYARGSQPTEKYKRTFNNGEDGVNKLLVVDWRVLPIMAKLMTVVNGILAELTFRPQINPIDDLAQEEIQKEILYNEAKIAFRKQLEEMNASEEVFKTGGLEFEQGDATDMDELAVKELGMRHRTAMELEQVVETVFSYNNFEYMMQLLNMDMVKYGVCVVKTECVNKADIRILREDPRNLVMSYCLKPDFSDWRYIGLVRSVPVSELIQMSDGELTKGQIEEVYKLGQQGSQTFGGSQFSWGVYNTWNEFWLKGSVYILDLEIRSTDKRILEKRVTKDGNKVYSYTNPEKIQKDNEYEQAEVENIYCCKWIIGTETVFNVHKKRNMMRNEMNISKVEPSIRVYGCDVHNMMAKSRVEELIAYADGIQYAYYKLQHLLNTQVPAGYAINYDALESIDLSAGAEKLTPKDVVDLFFDRGILIHRSQGVEIGGKPLSPPITPISNQFGVDLMQYWTMINTNINLMKETLGLNDLTDGSTPNSRTVSEIARAAMGGTKNALSDIFANQRKMIKEVVHNIVRHCQYIVKDGNSGLLASALGDGTIKTLKSIKDVDKYLYSVSIAENPTQEELISLQEQIKIGQQQGVITVDNVFMLDNMSNVKQKQAYLINVVRKNREQAKKDSMELQAMNAQVQQQSALMAEQAKQQTIQLEYQLKMQADLQRIKAEMEKEVTIEQIRLEGKRIDASGRVEASEVQALGRDVNNQRDNEVKLELANAKNKEVAKSVKDFESAVQPQTAFEQPLELQEFPLT